MTTSEVQQNGHVLTPDLETLKALLLNDPTDRIIVGDEVAFHDDPNNKKIVLPQKFGFRKAIAVLEAKQREQEEPTEFGRNFNYLYPDGVVATNDVLQEMYGMTLAKGIPTFFGNIPAQMADIQIGHDQRRSCMAGVVEIPTLEGSQIRMMRGRDRKHGMVFRLEFEGPRKHKSEVERFFDAVDRRLKTFSIYRGKAVAGTEELEFLNLRNFRRNEVVYSDAVEDLLSNLLYGPIRNSAFYREEGIPLKRAVLLYGPFGTGKTSIGMITAQEAEENGWTYLTARPGDSVQDVLRVANLYQPAVVLVEDVEVATDTSSPREVSALLDAFDGATAKGSEIVLVLTSNHVEQISKGMLRPGRIDATIEIAALDRVGIERLIKVVVGEAKLDAKVDYDAVAGEMEGFLPAFVKAAIDRAKTWALNRVGPGYVLTTKDLVGGAASLKEQFKLMEGASEGKERPQIEAAFQTLVRDTVSNVVNETYWERGTNTNYDAELIHDAEAER